MKNIGLAVPCITPFDERGELDAAAYRRLVRWWIAEGVHALIPCGSNGEAAYLELAERTQLIEVAAGEAQDRLPVIAGTGLPSTKATLDLTRLAAHAGANAAMVITPFFYPLSQRELLDHYRAIADHAPIPVFLYNNPPLAHANLEPDSVAKLAEHENVHGIKDSSGDVAQLARIVNSVPPEFVVLAGNIKTMLAALEVGARGVVLALANLFPAPCARVVQQFRSGQLHEAKALHDGLVHVNEEVVGRHGIPGLKSALQARGLPAGHPRAPLHPVPPDAQKRIASIVERCDDAARA